MNIVISKGTGGGLISLLPEGFGVFWRERVTDT